MSRTRTGINIYIYIYTVRWRRCDPASLSSNCRSIFSAFIHLHYKGFEILCSIYVYQKKKNIPRFWFFSFSFFFFLLRATDTFLIGRVKLPRISTVNLFYTRVISTRRISTIILFRYSGPSAAASHSRRTVLYSLTFTLA